MLREKLKILLKQDKIANSELEELGINSYLKFRLFNLQILTKVDVDEFIVNKNNGAKIIGIINFFVAEEFDKAFGLLDEYLEDKGKLYIKKPFIKCKELM